MLIASLEQDLDLAAAAKDHRHPATKFEVVVQEDPLEAYRDTFLELSGELEVVPSNDPNSATTFKPIRNRDDSSSNADDEGLLKVDVPKTPPSSPIDEEAWLMSPRSKTMVDATEAAEGILLCACHSSHLTP